LVVVILVIIVIVIIVQNYLRLPKIYLIGGQTQLSHAGFVMILHGAINIVAQVVLLHLHWKLYNNCMCIKRPYLMK
jgi:hypothetical protein